MPPPSHPHQSQSRITTTASETDIAPTAGPNSANVAAAAIGIRRAVFQTRTERILGAEPRPVRRGKAVAVVPGAALEVPTRLPIAGLLGADTVQALAGRADNTAVAAVVGVSEHIRAPGLAGFLAGLAALAALSVRYVEDGSADLAAHNPGEGGGEALAAKAVDGRFDRRTGIVGVAAVCRACLKLVVAVFEFEVAVVWGHGSAHVARQTYWLRGVERELGVGENR